MGAGTRFAQWETEVTEMRQLSTTLFVLLVLTNSSQALPLALPSTGLSDASMSAPTKATSRATEDYFEDLIGREISKTEENTIRLHLEQTEEMQLRPQLVSTFGGTEVIPLICGQFKASAHWAKGLGGEVSPCFDPQTGRSYVMQGTSFNNSGMVTAALMAGVYVGPAHVQKPVVGEYGFIGLTKDLIPFVKFHGQVSADFNCLAEASSLSSKKSWAETIKECKFMAMGGLGISVTDLFKKFKDKLMKTPMDPAAGAAIPGWGEINIGVTFMVREFPWYERLKNGVTPRQAFADWQTYQAP